MTREVEMEYVNALEGGFESGMAWLDRYKGVHPGTVTVEKEIQYRIYAQKIGLAQMRNYYSRAILESLDNDNKCS